MNEELKNQLSTFLAKALDIAEKGIEATGEQIPMILQEIVQWEIYSNLIGFAFGVILAFVSCKFIRKTLMYFEKGEDDPMLIAPTIIIAIITGVIAFPCLACVFDAVKAFVAPRLVIIEYLKGLL